MKRIGEFRETAGEKEKPAETLHPRPRKKTAPPRFQAVENQTVQRLLRPDLVRSDRHAAVQESDIRPGSNPPENLFQRKSGENSAPDPAADPMPSSDGRPLDDFTRDTMENRFGTDFGGVRIHTGSGAEESARALDAEAYAVGNDIVFGAGRYRPYAPGGRRLIAHELAHVVQQKAVTEEGLAPDSPVMEQAAERAAQGARPGEGPVSAGGTARIGIARLPRSLGHSIDTSSLSPAEVKDEIIQIRRWLAGHPQLTADRQHLLGMLRRMEREIRPMTATEPAGREMFGAAFRREFGSVLPAFRETVAAYGRQSVVTADPEGVEFTFPDPLYDLFTPAQRGMLMDFIVTRRIPEGLFNGDEVGAATAQQRILMSAHILARGTYRPGSFDQRVHAQCCYHWVWIVYHYAGVTPEGGLFAKGVMGGFDMFGRAVIGAGRAQTVFMGRRVYAENLPDVEEPGGTGPILPGTGHARARAAELERLEADPSARRRVYRRSTLPFQRFNKIKAGDWITFYNANKSAGGSHSVIFSHWVGSPVVLRDNVRYWVASCFSQRTWSGGGREDQFRLGDLFSLNEGIYPITSVSRVSPDARPAVTPLEVLPTPPSWRLRKMQQSNKWSLIWVEGHYRRPVDLGMLRKWLTEQNFLGIISLGEHLTRRQQDLLEQINAADDIETLVRLNQWLHARAKNARILERSMAGTFNEQLAERHAREQSRIDREREQAQQELAEIDATLGPLRIIIQAQENIRSALDPSAEIHRLRAVKNELIFPLIEKVPPGPARDVLRSQRRELMKEIKKLVQQGETREGILRVIQNEIRRLHRQVTRLESRRTRLTGQREAEERDLPYGFLHPGGLWGQITRDTTGRLIDLRPLPPWKDLLVKAGEEAR
jgi:hypothetical protein